MLRIAKGASRSSLWYAPPLGWTSRRSMSIGGRKNPIGREGRDRSGVSKVKQGPALGVPRAIPGTTKITYTNRRGQTFHFTIPVSQIMHPQVLRNAPTPAGWREIDTSFSDTGDLEDEMPTAVDACLNRHTRAEPSTGAWVVGLDEAGLRDLLAAFVRLCKDYVLMDTNGMKTSLDPRELNVGPDYEMYDRKLMRKRAWLAVRRAYEDIRELLWPSAVLDAAGAADEAPLLSPEEMLEGLVWIEAASTFCVRKRQPYDVAGEEAFLPIVLTREVRVLARCVRGGRPDFFAPDAGAVPGDARADPEAPSELPRPREPAQRTSDRFISCAALCANHEVPFESFFVDAAVNAKLPTSEAQRAVSVILTTLPTLHTPADAIRVLSILLTVGEEGACFCFSRAAPCAGEGSPAVTFDAALLSGLARLCDSRIFADADAVADFGEAELCLLLDFVVRVWEQNVRFFRAELADAAARARRGCLAHFAGLVLHQCRRLLYRLDGPQTSVMAWDDARVPFLEHQRVAEKAHPLAHVHFKVGMRLAQGLRFARLRAAGSAAIAELLGRLEAAGGPGPGLLAGDLVGHVAQKVAGGREGLGLRDVLRVLPMLAGARPDDRLLAALAPSIAAALAHARAAPGELVGLVEGLAACGHAPSSLPQVEMALLRGMLGRRLGAARTTRALRALARLRGARGVAPSILQAAADVAVRTADGEEGEGEGEGGEGALMELVHALHRCHYDGFPALVGRLLAADAPFAGRRRRAAWPPAWRCSAGVLQALAGAADAEGGAALCEEARRELLGALDDGRPGDFGADLLAGAATVCAALGERRPAESLRAGAVDCSQLHSLCTPLLAVGVLESLEVLGLERTRMYEAYLGYLERVMGQLRTRPPKRLLVDDAEVAVRVLYLPKASPVIVRDTVAVLKHEIEELLSAPDDAAESASVAGNLFEQSAILKRDADKQLYERLQRYSSALEHVKAEAV